MKKYLIILVPIVVFTILFTNLEQGNIIPNVDLKEKLSHAMSIEQVRAMEPNQSLPYVIVANQTSGPPSDNISTDLNSRFENAQDVLGYMMINHDISYLPVFATFIDKRNSTLFVGINDNANLSKNVYHERLKTIVGDIPMNIQFGHFVLDSCTSQTSQCAPLIGGIEIESNLGFSTLTMPVNNTAGNKGFIMAGHGAGCGQTNVDIGQNTLSRVVGTVITNPSGSSRQSDSAFVELKKDVTGYYLFTTDPNKIYRGSNLIYKALGMKNSSDTPFDTPVKMEGYRSGLQSGTIQSYGVQVTGTCATYQNQMLANYYSESGDSGAPIFSSPDANNNVYFYGLHIGRIVLGPTSYPVYSPWEGIKSELSIVQSCLPPDSGDWTITSSCTLASSSVAPANVIVQNNVVLTVPSGLSLDVDFASKHLLVNSGGKVLIKNGGKIF